jgi:hypothetical protein
VGYKCLSCEIDFLSPFSNSTLYAWNTVHDMHDMTLYINSVGQRERRAFAGQKSIAKLFSLPHKINVQYIIYICPTSAEINMMIALHITEVYIDKLHFAKQNHYYNLV